MKKKKKFKPESIEKIKEQEELQPKKAMSTEIDVRTIKDVYKVIKTNIFFFILLALIAFAVYFKVIKGEFVNIDDLAGIVNNATIRSLKTAWEAGFAYQFMQAVIFKIFGLSSTAYHVVSILLHIWISIMVFIFAYSLFGKRVAQIATLLFVVNPTGSEAINWLSASGYLYQAVLTLISLQLYVLYKKSNQISYYYTLVIFYALCIIFVRTSWLLVIPFLLFIIDFLLFNHKFKWKKIYLYIPLIVISLLFVYVEVIGAFKNRAYTLETQHYLSIKAATPYLNRIPYTIFMMFRQYIVPIILTIYHEGRIIDNPEYTLMVITTLAYTLLCIYLFKKSKQYLALLIALPICTLPSLSPIAIAWLIAERYLYLGVTFFTILLAKVFVDLSARFNKRKLATVFTVIFFLFYFGRTFVRAGDFANSKNLWISTRAVAPLSYRVYNNLGDVYANEGNYELAIENFIKSLQLKPDYADAVHNLGFTYMQMGNADAARYYLIKSFEMNPRLYQSLFKLGYIDFQLKNYESAKFYFEKTLEVNPGNNDAITMLNQIKILEQQK